MTPGRIFVVGMLAFGVVFGLVAATTPAVRDFSVPAVTWPILVGFAVEALLAARAGGGASLTMGERASGVFGSALVVAVLVAVVGA